MQLTPDELTRRELKPETLELAVALVKANGYVVFERVLSSEVVSELHEAFLRLLEEHVRAAQSNRGVNRYQMHLPFRAPFNDPSVIAHPFALAVLDKLLGADSVCQYFASDTPLPGSELQQVHADIQPLFRDEAGFNAPPFCVVLNIPLVDFGEDNGPLEVWPGGSHWCPPDVNVAELAPLMASKRLLMPAGSLLLRDMRMWHRGTPNHSNAPRPNLALIYARPWLKTHYPPIVIPRATYRSMSERAQRLFRMEKIVDEPAAD